MGMDSLSGEIKMFPGGTKMPPEKGFNWMPQVGEVIRFEGTKFCFKIKRIDPKKVILKPVPSSKYNPPAKSINIKPNPDDGHFDV